MNNYLNIPGYGDSHWKSPVASAANLPTTGNQPGDVRVVLDTYATYVWNTTTWLIDSGGNAFGIIQTPFGTFPVADGHTDALTFTSLDNTVTITGDSTTDSVDFSVNIPPSGISSINSDTTSAQTLTVGTSGTDFAIVNNLSGNHLFNLPTASTLNRGALSSTDWTTFNSKQPAGNYITALTGDVSASGPGSSATTLSNTTVTPGSYTLSSITVDSKGRITAASSGSAGTITNVTASSPLFSSGGSTPNITIQVASTSQNGYLSNTDWNTFNSKQSSLTPGTISTATPGINIGGGSSSTVGPNVTIDIVTANATRNGLLTSTDWSTFNNKQSALTFGSITTSTTGITITNGSNSTVGPAVTLNVQTASGSQPGLLSSTDWTTFNNKQAAGSYITALTGDVTASGPGSSAATVKTNLKTASIGTTIDGGGFVITTGLKSFVTIPYACTITAVTMLADVVGSIVVDIWKVNYAGFPGSVANTITSATPPTISSAQKSTDSTLSGWTTTVNAGDILEFNVNSASTITKVNLVLTVVKT